MYTPILISFRTGLAIVALGTLVALTSVNAADVQDSEEVAALLTEAKGQAYQISLDASTMESYTRSSATWESHAIAVNQMKNRINAVGRTLTKLDDARANASPWQATAIDRIRPLLKELASNTETVILYLNKNPKRLTMTEFKDLIEANSDVASQLSGLISSFVDYGNTKNKLERLTSKLELPSK